MGDVANILGGRPWRVEKTDCLTFMRQLPNDCVSLVFFSPPYTGARLYLEGGEDLGIARDAESWVAWMVEVFREATRICTGLVACVCDDQTENYRYGCAPYLLMADLHRAGFNLRRPCVYRRSGIPGSGGPDWFRCDHEPIICVTRPGKLPWSNVTACGHPPKWAPGGEMSHRLTDGTRRNDWGMNGTTGRRNRKGKQETMVGYAEEQPQDDAVPVWTNRHGMPSADETGAARRVAKRKSHTKAKPNGADKQQSYAPPVLANPGTVVDCVVGGGQMGEGDKFSRGNEAPFPEELPERFVLSFAAPGSVVYDCFAGSGTTLAVAHRHGRLALGTDLRQSQVDLTTRRLREETPLDLFNAQEASQ